MLKIKGKSGYVLSGNKGERRWHKTKEPAKPVASIPLSTGKAMNVHIVQGKLITPMRVAIKGSEEDRMLHGINQGANDATVIVGSDGKKYYVKDVSYPQAEVGDSQLASELNVPVIKSYYLGPKSTNRFGTKNTMHQVASELAIGHHPMGDDNWDMEEIFSDKSRSLLGTVPMSKADQDQMMQVFNIDPAQYDPRKAAVAAGRIAYMDALTENTDGWALHQTNPGNILLINGIPHGMDFDGSDRPVSGFGLSLEYENGGDAEFKEHAERRAKDVQDAYKDLRTYLPKHPLAKFVRYGFADAHKRMITKDLGDFQSRLRSDAFSSVPDVANFTVINPHLQDQLRTVRII